MMKLLLKITLGLSFILLAPSLLYALPKCSGSPKKWKLIVGNPEAISDINFIKENWKNCRGTFGMTDKNGQFVFRYTGSFRNGDPSGYGVYDAGRNFFARYGASYGVSSIIGIKRYVGESKGGKFHGEGIGYYWNGKIKEGVWKDMDFQYKKKTSYSVTQSKLSKAFRSLSSTQRKKVQLNLKNFGLYKSSVDGLWGNGTKTALINYNRLENGNSDLNKTANINQLFTTILRVDQVPKRSPKTTPFNTYNVASGSGFYVSDKGHIITNHHVISGCKEIKAHYEGQVSNAIKITEDKRNDLALLKVSPEPKHVFSLSTESPYPTQEILVAGFPFGDKISSTLKFTQGIVSSIAGLGNDYSQIQIDAAIQPGNSGGPILDKNGNVLGVAVAKLSLKKILKDYGVIPENTNFGVKVTVVKNLLEGNGIKWQKPTTKEISGRELSKKVTEGTVFLSCWMTMAQIEKFKTSKVLFSDFASE